MNKKLIALAAAATVSSFAFADGMDGAYVGMGMGFSTLTNYNGGTSLPGLGLYAGYDLADWFQFEGSFYSASFSPIGKSYTGNIENSRTGDNVVNAVVANNGSTNTLALTGKFDWWWVDSFGIYAKIGLGMQYNAYNTTYYPVAGSVIGRNPQASGSNYGFEPAILGGLGLQWNIGKVGLRIEDMYQVSSNDNQAPGNGLGSFNTYGFLVQYHF